MQVGQKVSIQHPTSGRTRTGVVIAVAEGGLTATVKFTPGWDAITAVRRTGRRDADTCTVSCSSACVLSIP